MNVYCLVTPSHQSLYQDWFLRTLPRDCKPFPEAVNADPQVFAQGLWHQVVVQKFSLLERAFSREPSGGVFVMSDVDIRFYEPFAYDLEKRICGLDVLFQHNRPSLPPIARNVCTGFMAIRNTLASRQFFRQAHDCLLENDHPEVGDQNACIQVLEQQPNDLGFGLLPRIYWSPGSRAGRWMPGMSLKPPAGLILHHANHTVGNENKNRQLKYVEEIVANSEHFELNPQGSPA